MKYLIGLMYVIFLGLVFTGCGLGKDPAREQKNQTHSFEQGFEMVDQGRFEEALLYFKRMYETKPTDDALKAWASVYVARAGLKISSLYNALSTFPTDKNITQENLLAQIQVYKKSLEQIPYVKGEARDDLQSATALLQARNSSSVRLFRGILNLVLLRATFSDGDKSLLNANFKVDVEKDLKTVCKLDWENLRTWLHTWTFYGLELKKDLVFTYPSRKKDWEEGSKFFIEARKVSTSLVKACEP